MNCDFALQLWGDEWKARAPGTDGQVSLVTGHVGGETTDREWRPACCAETVGEKSDDAERQRRTNPEDEGRLCELMRGDMRRLDERAVAPARASDIAAARI